MFILAQNYLLKQSFGVEPSLMYVLHFLVVFMMFVGVCLYTNRCQYVGTEELV
jgi:hypothetical protein